MRKRKDRIRRLEQLINDVVQTRVFGKRTDVDGDDAIGRLGQSLNSLLSAFEKSYELVKRYAFKAVLTQKKEHKLRKMFQQYVPEEIIKQISLEPEPMPESEIRLLAILNSDVHSMNEISGMMRPDELVTSLNHYFSLMIDIVMEHRGIVDIMRVDNFRAFFGAPVQHDDDAEQALRSAIRMQEGLVEFNKWQQQRNLPKFKIGIGLHYGAVVVGNTGSPKKMDYTVIGNIVNVASQLALLTKAYSVPILIPESIASVVRDKIKLRIVDRVTLRGGWRGTLYVPSISPSPVEDKAWGIHNRATKLYYERNFREAAALFERVISRMLDDPISNRYLIRCQKYIATPPPPEWDGHATIVFTDPYPSE